MAATLGGCIDSENPLLPENGGMADPAFAGSFALRGPHQFNYDTDIYTRGNRYLVVARNKDEGFELVGTLHPWRKSVSIFQYRNPRIEGETNFYALVRKDGSGFVINFIGCEPRPRCPVTSREQLFAAARRTADRAGKKDTVVARREDFVRPSQEFAAPIVGKVRRGALRATVQGRCGDWCQVRFKGTRGWVRRTFDAPDELARRLQPVQGSARPGLR